MRKDFAKRLRLFYGIFLGAVTVVIGILFIVSAADIYYSAGGGQGMYSREVVGEKLYALLIPSCVWILAVVAGYVLSVLFPVAGKRGGSDSLAVFRRLRSRMPKAEGEEFLSERAKIKKSDLARIAVWSVCAAVCLVSAIMSIVYLCDTAHFPNADKNAEVLAMLRNIFPWIGASLLLCCAAVAFEMILAKRDLPRMKKLIALGKGYPAEEGFLSSQRKAAVSVLGNDWCVVGIRLALLTVATAFILTDLISGLNSGFSCGLNDVFVKAVNICTECIGLG